MRNKSKTESSNAQIAGAKPLGTDETAVLVSDLWHSDLGHLSVPRSFCQPYSERFLRWLIRSAVFAVFLLTYSARQWAAEPEPIPPSSVVATVDGDPITAGELQRELDLAVKDRALAPATLQPVRDATLKQLIDRRLVAAYINKTALRPPAGGRSPAATDPHAARTAIADPGPVPATHRPDQRRTPPKCRMADRLAAVLSDT